MKICSTCKIKKKNNEFGLLKSSKDGLRNQCKKCRNKSVRRRRLKKNLNHVKGVIVSQWQKQYTLTREEAMFLYEIKRTQRCLICNQKHKKSLHCDHDHRSGIFRGLLCDKCNKGLGFFLDNTQLLENAIQYLNNPPGISYYKSLDK